MPETSEHVLSIPRHAIVGQMATLILSGESDTYASDDAENRPDADSLYLLANQLGLRAELDKEILKRTPTSIYTFHLVEGSLAVQVDIRSKTKEQAENILAHALGADAFAPWNDDAAQVWTGITGVRVAIDPDKVHDAFELVDVYEEER